MFAPINPQNEERRAQAIVDSLTDRNQAAAIFASRNAQSKASERSATANRNYGQMIVRAFKALKPNRRPVVDEPVQRPVGSPRQVTNF